MGDTKKEKKGRSEKGKFGNMWNKERGNVKIGNGGKNEKCGIKL